jgi:hypothetical protein
MVQWAFSLVAGTVPSMEEGVSSTLSLCLDKPERKRKRKRKRNKSKINQTSISFYLMSVDILCSSVKALPLALATA